MIPHDYITEWRDQASHIVYSAIMLITKPKP